MRDGLKELIYAYRIELVSESRSASVVSLLFSVLIWVNHTGRFVADYKGDFLAFVNRNVDGRFCLNQKGSKRVSGNSHNLEPEGVGIEDC